MNKIITHLSVKERHFSSNDRPMEALEVDVTPELTKNNIHWNIALARCYRHSLEDTIVSFEDSEEQFYAQHFSRYCTAKGLTTSEYLKSEDSSPVEFLFKYDESVPLGIIVMSLYNLPHLIAEHFKTKRGVQRAYVLDWAIHRDELSLGTHVHIRVVWLANTRVSGRQLVPHASFGMSIIKTKESSGRLSYLDYRTLLFDMLLALHTSITRMDSSCRVYKDSPSCLLEDVRTLDDVPISDLTNLEQKVLPISFTQMIRASKDKPFTELFSSLGDSVAELNIEEEKLALAWVKFRLDVAILHLAKVENCVAALKKEIAEYNILLETDN